MPGSSLRHLLEGVILAEPLLAAEALEAVQLGSDEPVENFEGLKAFARFLRKPHERVIVEGLAARKLLRAFTLALSVRGANLPEGWEEALREVDELREVGLGGEDAQAGEAGVEAGEDALQDPLSFGEEEQEDNKDLFDTTIGDADRARFERLAASTRCRIRINGRVSGSGTLVGPSTVLTAWHVVREADGSKSSRIDVDFADGSRIPAVLPARFHSRCGDRELEGLFPQNDNEVADFHDVALLQLRRPVGASLGRVVLAEPEVQLRTNAAMILVHYPEGTYRGFSYGVFYKLRGITSRWGHSINARGGSSGGGCFNSGLALVGIHQGRAPDCKRSSAPRGRLVPANRFPEGLRDLIKADESPPQAWSLDGTPHGPLVLGRQNFFTAFAAASRPASRIRGIRVRRVNAEADVSGIPFTYLMLDYLVARGVELRSLRISFEATVRDFTDEVLKRARDEGFDLPPVDALAGVAADQTTLEAAASDRARRAAVQLNAAAAGEGVRLWIFLEHPSAVFGDELRVGFEAFVDQALRLDNLRLVVAGYEALTVPGQEFRYAADAEREGAPGLMTEFLDGFRRGDVEHLLATAASELGVNVELAVIRDIAERVLEDRVASGGVYAPSSAGAVAEALRPELRRFARKSPTIGTGDAD